MPAALITAFTLCMPKDVGVRCLLPVLALWATAAGGGLAAALDGIVAAWQKRLAVATVGTLLGATVPITAGSFPGSIA